MKSVYIKFGGGGSSNSGTAKLVATGQTVSFATGDDGDVQYGRDFFELDQNNIFGNKWRFTGKTGGYYDRDTSEYKDVNGVVTTRALAYIDDCVYDWSTYNEADGSVLMYKTAYYVQNWNNAFSEVIPNINTTEKPAGFDDWTMTNYRQLTNIFLCKDGAEHLEYEEFGNISTYLNIWTSSSYSSTHARCLNNLGGGGNIAKTSTGVYLFICRIGNISEL